MEKYVSPQMPDTRPNMRQKALFVTSNASFRYNKMILVEPNVDIPRAAIAVVKPLPKIFSAVALPHPEGHTKAQCEITLPARRHRSHFSPRSTLCRRWAKTHAGCSSRGRANMCETVEAACIDLSTWNVMHRSSIGDCNQWKPARYSNLDVSVRQPEREAGKTHVCPRSFWASMKKV